MIHLTPASASQRLTTAAVALAAACLAPSALAIQGGTLTDNGAYYQHLGYDVPFGDGWWKAPGNVSTGLDQLYKNQWYYRVGNASGTCRRFAALLTPVETWSGNLHTATFTRNGAFDNFFDAKFVTRLVGSGPSGTQSLLYTTLTITNVMSSARTYDIFHCVDMDLGGWDGLSDDQVTIDPADRTLYRFTDPVDNLCEVRGIGATFYQLGLSTSTWKPLNSTATVNFTNLGSGTTGDVSGGLQWRFTLQPGQTKVIESVVGLNRTAPVPCAADYNFDGFLDFSDFDSFIADFEAGKPSADANLDGFLDFTDFDTFVAAFESGC